MMQQVPSGFIQRLENWGAYYRPQRRAFESATYRVCQNAATAAGQQIKDGYREVRPKTEIDAEDAQTMERHWSMCAYRVDKKHRAIVKAFYVDAADPRLICRLLQVRWLSWESELRDATLRFYEAVALLESAPYNRSHNLIPSLDVT